MDIDVWHQWIKNPSALELICERCKYIAYPREIARFGWNYHLEDDIYWALGGNDLESNGCCPRRVN